MALAQARRAKDSRRSTRPAVGTGSICPKTIGNAGSRLNYPAQVTTRKRATLNTTFETAEDSLGFLLWKASNTLQRLHADCLRELDVTTTQFSLLTCLVYLQQGGAVTASSIVTHAGMDKMLVSDVVTALVRKGFVRKTANPVDARSSLLTATALGVRVTNAAVQQVEAVDAEFFNRLPDVDMLRVALRTLVTQTASSSFT